ncbi:L-serine dehydratase 1 [Grosmannia clavigera kw1407]|uniref:L-serine dehydratase 1 n=1 Tax=Grosmannia clavigera (strain kw1407 / UAMH 11150) TaxID=655863 RepID=F0XNB0_GROCL|nr:L-serine dehydratase 1 [Grosmannia clavigera kw1407]EFX00869.1 L-serine dehydratase 1 [Grosmannia clavigera kw1407]
MTFAMTRRFLMRGVMGESRTASVIRAVRPPLARPSLEQTRLLSRTRQQPQPGTDEPDDAGTYSESDHEHAVISTFDLFSIGIGPSSSHTVGPMRAGNIFIVDLAEAGLLDRVHKIRVAIYGSLALTGEGHMTPSAILLGLESADVETVETAYVPTRFEQIKATRQLVLGRGLADGSPGRTIDFDYSRDFVWEWGRKLPMHSNGMRFTVFDADGYVLARNDMFSVGGGFVVNGALSVNPLPGSSDEQRGHPADLSENLFYKETRRSDASGDRRSGAEVRPLSLGDGDAADETLLPGPPESTSLAAPAPAASATITSVTAPATAAAPADKSSQPRYPFRDAASLLSLCRKHNLTIAQLVYENERSHGYSDEEIYAKLARTWQVMDNSILESVQAPLNAVLPGSLKLHRRAPALYRRLTRGLYSAADSDATRPSSPSSAMAALPTGASLAKRVIPRIHGALDHPIAPSPPRRTAFPAMDYLTVYAIAVNETNAAGGRIVTAPTNGAAGIIPAVLKYIIEFISDDAERDICTFLLTAAAIGMLYKRGATISAAEGGCMAEVGVACSMAAGAFAACMGAGLETIEMAAEIGIEHNLGLTCDPIGGLVQAPCIERNALGAVKAVSSANLALSSSPGTQKVRLDDAIQAMRLTAKGMRNEFKETSLSGLATSVPLHIPVSVPDC